MKHTTERILSYIIDKVGKDTEIEIGVTEHIGYINHSANKKTFTSARKYQVVISNIGKCNRIVITINARMFDILDEKDWDWALNDFIRAILNRDKKSPHFYYPPNIYS